MADGQEVSGVIGSDGKILSGSGFTVERIDEGEYQVVFSTAFTAIPALVGSQVLFKKEGQDPRDNVVFPFLAANGFTAITGDSGGSHKDRNFAFIARA